MRTTTARRRSVAAALFLLLSACGGDPVPASTPDAGADNTPAASPAGSEQPSAPGQEVATDLAPDTATMTVDGVSYEFSMDTCKAGEDVLVALGTDANGVQVHLELYRDGHVFQGKQSHLVRLTTPDRDWKTSTVNVLEDAGEEVPELSGTVITDLAVSGGAARGAAAFYDAETLDDARYFDKQLVTTDGTFELHCSA